MNTRNAASFRLLVCIAGWIFSSLACAERLPVLGQIDLPHPYYYREMYLPQLTAGPSSLAWSPDSTELIYSMGGSLWRQSLNSTVATQLAATGGYDYQPDWSSDGRWVIFTSYSGARRWNCRYWICKAVRPTHSPVTGQ